MRKRDPAHLARVAALGCIVHGPECREVQLHHIRHGQGMGQRADDREAIGLCHYLHQGEQGIHTLGTRRWQAIYGTELELLQKTLALLGMP